MTNPFFHKTIKVLKTTFYYIVLGLLLAGGVLVAVSITSLLGKLINPYLVAIGIGTPGEAIGFVIMLALSAALGFICEKR